MDSNRIDPSSVCTIELSPSTELLYSRKGLRRLDDAFLRWLDGRDRPLADAIVSGRVCQPDSARESELWAALAPWFDEFIAEFFRIGAEVSALRRSQGDLAVLFEIRRNFVQRRALKEAKTAQFDDAADLLPELEFHLGEKFTEMAFAKSVTTWLGDEATYGAQLKSATAFAAWAATSRVGRTRFGDGVLFHLPVKRDPLARFEVSSATEHGAAWLRSPRDPSAVNREGFNLTDPGCTLAGGLAEINYCILCHHQGKDSCSKGIKTADGFYQKTVLGARQTGCPLGERISEMHEAKQRGFVLSSLAIACVDNPMIAGTGHRICNDCMVACIYQSRNRDPVNVPQAETRILKDVLNLPWGFEIYSLLTRWNPFNFSRPVPLPASGRSVLVIGLGPAGYTLAHHLMNEGHAVVAVDGLKIEPLPPGLGARDGSGSPADFTLIRDVSTLWTELGARIGSGFGGVAEYGITVRWDKNFLTLLRLLLERRTEFALYGGTRFGGALTTDSAFALGFDHIALCTGAGKPTVLAVPNALAPGVRQASDFLMALQLTGGARPDSLANLQLRMPVVVIGGGLTAIDTCTEALAYYPVQVEKFLCRFEEISERDGEASVRAGWSAAESQTAAEFLEHGRALRAEREAAAREGRPANIIALLRGWGGGRIVYRRRMTASPAYRNHEEIEKALEEGIEFGEDLTPIAIEIDEHRHARGVRLQRGSDAAEISVPARTILVAAGTVPNTLVAREQPGYQIDGRYFRALDEHGNPVTPERSCKPSATHILTRLTESGSAVSFFGDLHPSYAGNVVTAMASAKNGYPIISRRLARTPPRSTPDALRGALHEGLTARVARVARLTGTIVEVVVKAPLAASEFRPGQFFRLQNFESIAAGPDHERLSMEGLALTGAWADVRRGEVGLIVLEMGGSSNLCEMLTIGEPVVLMGPTGEPTYIPKNETVLLAGGGLGNAVLFSIGRAMRQRGCRVVYFAGYKNSADVFKRDDIEAAADCVVWCCDRETAPAPRRQTDFRFVGNIVEAMSAYAQGRLGPTKISLRDIDRLIAIGSDRMMAAIAAARQGELEPYLKPGHVALASINSPMQCMMKEICGQCLQMHRDPDTGEETVVFTCANQDQRMDSVRFTVLRDRLSQNTLAEKLTSRWLRTRCHPGAPIPDTPRS
jgi:NADPH-dependent glutamate synthase beta subunit-like oxidoreductase/NAD(P)H-flavin reductase